MAFLSPPLLLVGCVSLAALASACQAKESAPGSRVAVDAPAQVTVVATDTDCALSATAGRTGTNTFVVTNNGNKVTEFYVYGEGERVMGEVENISPGLDRTLIVHLSEPGTYRTACKPGMIGNGIRGDYSVTGDTVAINTDARVTEAADSYKRYVNSQTDALIAATADFTAALTNGDVAKAKALYPVARTYYERIEPVAESFPNDLDPRIDLREADIEPGRTWTGFHALEKQLWDTGLQSDAAALADQLNADVKELDTGVKAPDWTIDVAQVAGQAQTLLDEIARTKVSGEEDIFSHTDLWDFAANVDGSQTAVASVRSILDERNPDLGTRVDRRFAAVKALIENYRSGDGFVLYDTVTGPQRQELSRAIDALSKEVSQVQGIVAG